MPKIRAALGRRLGQGATGTVGVVVPGVDRAAGLLAPRLVQGHEHPDRHVAAQRAPLPGDAGDEAASRAAAQVVFDVLAGYGLHDEEAVDATRALRSALHGFVSLEAGGGFGLPVDVDRSFDWLVRDLMTVLSDCPERDSTALPSRLRDRKGVGRQRDRGER